MAPPPESAFAPQIILHLVVIAREIESQHALVRYKNQPPRQVGAAFVKTFAQLPDCQTRVGVWIAKAIQHRFQRSGHLSFSSGIPHDLLEPLGQFNGNHLCSR